MEKKVLMLLADFDYVLDNDKGMLNNLLNGEYDELEYGAVLDWLQDMDFDSVLSFARELNPDYESYVTIQGCDNNVAIFEEPTGKCYSIKYGLWNEWPYATNRGAGMHVCLEGQREKLISGGEKYYATKSDRDSHMERMGSLLLSEFNIEKPSIMNNSDERIKAFSDLFVYTLKRKTSCAFLNAALLEI